MATWMELVAAILANTARKFHKGACINRDRKEQDTTEWGLA